MGIVVRLSLGALRLVASFGLQISWQRKLGNGKVLSDTLPSRPLLSPGACWRDAHYRLNNARYKAISNTSTPSSIPTPQPLNAPHSTMHPLSSILLAAAGVASVTADLGKSSLFPQGLHDPLSAMDNSYNPPNSFVYVTPPSLCVQHAQASGCNTATLQAISATYGDCSTPWTICRCESNVGPLGCLFIVLRYLLLNHSLQVTMRT